jgi:putative phosphoesterase
LHFKETELVQLAKLKFLLHHIVDVHAPSQTVQRRLIKDDPDVVIFGHTHKPFNERIGKALFFNPGYAGKPRFALPRTVAILHCENGVMRPEYKEL